MGDILNVVTIVNEDQLQIMGGAILVNGELESLTADQARVIVQAVERSPMPKVDRKDIDVIEGDTSLSCLLLLFPIVYCVDLLLITTLEATFP